MDETDWCFQAPEKQHIDWGHSVKRDISHNSYRRKFGSQIPKICTDGQWKSQKTSEKTREEKTQKEIRRN